LSVYLNTQPDQHGRTPDAAPYLQREFKALARTWAPGSPEPRGERGKTRLCSNPSAASPRSCGGARKLAIGVLITRHVQDH
jgi:hypothetical protein